MTDKLVFELNDKWAVLFDDRQWIVASKRTRAGKAIWRPVAFVASTRVVLERVIGELGVTPARQAQRTLNQLENTFKLWYRNHLLGPVIKPRGYGRGTDPFRRSYGQSWSGIYHSRNRKKQSGCG